MSRLGPPRDPDHDVPGGSDESWENDPWHLDDESTDPLHGLQWLLSPQMKKALETFRLDDPARVVQQVATRMRERAHLVDQSRLFMGTLTRIAMYYETYDGEIPARDWVGERIDEAMHDQIVRDREDERRGLPILSPYQPRFEYLAGALGIPFEYTRMACIVVNSRPEDERRVFFETILMRRSISRLVSRGLGTRAELEAKLRSCLEALAESGVGFDLKTFQPRKGGKPFDIEGLGDA